MSVHRSPWYDPQNNDVAYDHLIPHNQEKCGLHLYGNIVITTKAVNAAKHRKDYKDFILDDTKVIKGSAAERERIITKIENFRKESGYDEKLKIKKISGNFTNVQQQYERYGSDKLFRASASGLKVCTGCAAQ